MWLLGGTRPQNTLSSPCRLVGPWGGGLRQEAVGAMAGAWPIDTLSLSFCLCKIGIITFLLHEAG